MTHIKHQNIPQRPKKMSTTSNLGNKIFNKIPSKRLDLDFNEKTNKQEERMKGNE